MDVSQAPLPPRSHKGKQKAVEPAHVGENSAPLDSQDALADELPHDTEASNVAESSRKKPAVDGKKNRPEELKKNIAREMRDWEAKWKELAPKFAVTDLSQIPDGSCLSLLQILTLCSDLSVFCRQARWCGPNKLDFQRGQLRSLIRMILIRLKSWLRVDQKAKARKISSL